MSNNSYYNLIRLAYMAVKAVNKILEVYGSKSKNSWTTSW